MVLRYLRYVEDQRTDIELDSFYPAHLLRLREWQEKYRVSERPFVFLGRLPAVWNHVTHLDSLQVDEKRWIYIQREPLRFDD